MKTFIKKIILFTCILVITSYAAYFALNVFQLNYYKTSLKTRWAIELKEQHTDYVFLGSSRMANTIAADDFNKSLNTTSINLATPGSSYGESYVLFQQYLAHGNTTKHLVLSFDLFKSRHINRDAEAFTPLVFKQFDFLPYADIPEVKAVYKSYTPEWHLNLWKFLPFSQFAEFNSYFKTDSMLQFISSGKAQQPSFDTRTGEQLIYNFKFKGERISAPGVIQLGPRSEEYLLKILALAKKNNITITLVTAPYYKMESFDRKTHTAYVNFLKDNYHARYIDFTASKEWTDHTFFSDPIHTNVHGSRLYTKMLCDSLHVE